MQISKLGLLLLCLFGCTASPQENTQPMESTHSSSSRPEYVLLIHGGAGTIRPEGMSPEKEKAYEGALETALQAGENILQEGGTALDAVCAAIQRMEDNPLFNAGRGAVLTHKGTAELDASLMEGLHQEAGAVGGVSRIKSPILAARAVLEKSPHVMLTGSGAEAFAEIQSLEMVSPDYFITPEKQKSLERVQKEEQKRTGFLIGNDQGDWKYGTVGAVALDKEGNLAAGTSTGGMTNKRYQRIGDSPIIGAGTYADNATCAVSCTGHGEYFIRYAVAHDLSARLAYTDQTLEEAANAIIHQKLKEKGGAGGLIAIDREGNIAWPFNTPGMFRAYVKPGEQEIKMYKEE